MMTVMSLIKQLACVAPLLGGRLIVVVSHFSFAHHFLSELTEYYGLYFFPIISRPLYYLSIPYTYVFAHAGAISAHPHPLPTSPYFPSPSLFPDCYRYPRTIKACVSLYVFPTCTPGRSTTRDAPSLEARMAKFSCGSD